MRTPSRVPRPAAALAAAIAIAALTAASAQATPRAVTSGALDWGVKDTFSQYVLLGAADGAVTPADGAAANADGTFRFPAVAGTVDDATGRGAVQLGGSLRFSGHGGQLDLTISGLRAELGAAGGVLRADLLGKRFSGPDLVAYPNVVLARLDTGSVTPSIAGSAVTWRAVPTAFGADARPAFVNVYQAGEPMDPLTIAVELGAPTGDASAEPQIESVPIATVKPAGRTIRVGEDRRAVVATVACALGPCRVTLPRRVRSRIGAVRVTGPGELASGKAAQVRVVAPRRAKRIRATVRIPIAVTGPGETVDQTVTVALR